MLSPGDLSRLSQHKTSIRKNVYQAMLEKCMRCMKRQAQVGATSCEFHIPHFECGYPLYDVRACGAYVVRKLRSLGFTVAMNDYVVYVMWTAPQPLAAPAPPAAAIVPPVPPPTPIVSPPSVGSDTPRPRDMWLPARLDTSHIHPMFRDRRGASTGGQISASVVVGRKSDNGGLVISLD
jgi:hypothetical protein